MRTGQLGMRRVGPHAHELTRSVRPSSVGWSERSEPTMCLAHLLLSAALRVLQIPADLVKRISLRCGFMSAFECLVKSLIFHPMYPGRKMVRKYR